MKFTTYIFCAILMLITTLSILWYRAPLFNGEWNKQTLYVGLLDALYGASKDDRTLHGPRGNLRDSQGDSLTTTIEGKIYPLHNWCWQFDLPLKD